MSGNDEIPARIGALVKTSLVDYPGRVAAAVFCRGCNLRCPYCYNAELVTGALSDDEAVTVDQILAHLEKRKNVLTGFVLSGGEPLLCPVAAELVSTARKLGYHIKLDTNGILPEKLAAFIDSPDLQPDFIALDVKTAPVRYGMLAPSSDPGLAARLLQSIKLVSVLPAERREFRTVLVPSLVTKNDIAEIAAALPKDAAWKFAPFKPGNCLEPSYNESILYNDREMAELVAYARKFVPGAELR
ncbi:MAG: anaerobic ribonucleoside-triphosphate reductase activating protein [Treponema sp.]|jgi:pyruvate formate lyase activating enzyme|nr:anaerobic ribonucleoside-triphosphate reductase activating protein [Treponema sp.]